MGTRVIAIGCLVLVAQSAAATTGPSKVRMVENFSGPRLGLTGLIGEPAERAKEKGLAPIFSQFGWQFEVRFATGPDLTGLVEFVPLIGGLDQGFFIPSLSVLVGLRIKEGFDVAAGPNLTVTNLDDPAKWFGLVLAVGQTIKGDGFAFPIHVAVVPQKGGARLSLLLGFTWD